MGCLLRAIAAAALVALVVPAPAVAQTGDDGAAAKVLFDEGRTLMAAEQYAPACAKFEESLRMSAGVGTQYNLAECYEKLGRRATAWGLFVQVAATTRASGQTVRSETAQRRAAALEPQLARLIVRVAPSPTSASGALVITRVREGDDSATSVGSAQWGSALPLDRGTYRIEATAPGKSPWTTTIDVAGDTVTVTVPRLEDAAPAHRPPVVAPPVALPAVPSPPVPEPAATVDDQGVSVQATAGIAVAGVGVLAVGASAVMGAVAGDNYGDSDAECVGGCSEAGLTIVEDAQALGNAATGVFIAGAALCAAGIVTFATGLGDSGVSVIPAAHGASGGTSLRLTW